MRSITIPFEILWADVDPLGYVYYPAIFRYVTEAESALFRTLGLADADLLALGYGKPRIHIEVHYHCPLVLHDTGSCTLTVQGVQHSRLHLAFSLRRHGDDKPAVTGSVLCAFIDLVTRRPVPIPRRIRDALTHHTDSPTSRKRKESRKVADFLPGNRKKSPALLLRTSSRGLRSRPQDE